MSAEPAPATVRERPGCVLGIAFGLLVLVSLVAWIAMPKGEARDGAQLFDAWFATTASPEGFGYTDARLLGTGEEVLQLARPGAGEERPLKEVPKEPSPGGQPRIQWARLEQGASDQPPRTLTFVMYPKARAQRELNRLFPKDIGVGSLDELGPFGGRVVLEFGTLPWNNGAAAFVLEREFERGGTFRDGARVNLSTAGDGLILRAAWSRSEPFSKARLQELLNALPRD